MQRTDKTMKYLYSGLGYEYYTASQLWRMGYEAYKMDADFGFDIMAYNQREQSFSNNGVSSPYLFQVKMRRIYEADLKKESTAAGERTEATTEFSFNTDDFMRLLAEERAYIVCYFVGATFVDVETILGCFWMNHQQLNNLWEGKNPSYPSSRWTWFNKSSDGKTINLKARIQTQADPKQYILDNLDYSDKFDEVIQMSSDSKIKRVINDIKIRNKKAIDWIGHSKIVNDNSNTNLFLIGTNSQGESKRIFHPEQTNLFMFPQKVNELPIVDN
jgi:hypothetical protein